MPSRAWVVVLAVAVTAALLVSAPSAVAAKGTGETLRAQSAVSFQSLLNQLKRLTQKSKKIWNSQDAQDLRKTAKRANELRNFYCGQWLDYYSGWTNYTNDREWAVYYWGRSYWTAAADAYRACRSLGYWPILLYG